MTISGILRAAVLGVAVAHCGGPPPCADGGECASGDADDATIDAPSDASGPDGGVDASGNGFVPFIAGEFARVFVPTAGYLNDHTLARGADGMWHVYGITDTSQGMPQAEHRFLHALAPDLFGHWVQQPDALVATRDEQLIWAPYAFERAPGQWSMYFYAGGTVNSLQRADSTDLTAWHRVDGHPPGGRDPFVLHDGGRWLLYSVGVSAASNGQILVSESRDLQAWTPPTVVIEDPVPSFGWGNLESPTVAVYRGAYYLFLTRTDESMTDYVHTAVFRSADPTRFAWRPITDIRAHAAEIVVDGDRWYITSAGWTALVGEINRGLSIAPLAWAPAP